MSLKLEKKNLKEGDNLINPHWEKEGFGILFQPVEDWEI